MSIASRLDLIARHTARRVCKNGRLPDFLIIGAQKAGSTSLFNYLCKSPDVCPPLRKEVHYFSAYNLPSIDWYEAFFPTSRRVGDKISMTGEATPLYLFHPDAAQRMMTIPFAPKFIAILRCPIDRAWSHYRHEKRKGREKLDFASALDAEQERLRGTTDRVLDRSHLESLMRHSYLSRGQYAAQLKRYQVRFGSERLYVLSLDRLKTDPVAAVSDCCKFLGIAEPDRSTPYKVYNAGDDNACRPDVAPGIFRDAFAQDLEQLESLLPEARLWRQRLEE